MFLLGAMLSPWVAYMKQAQLIPSCLADDLRVSSVGAPHDSCRYIALYYTGVCVTQLYIQAVGGQ
eukprot:7379184-Alexandrium_andersonii.AAC.1